jgi:hypothetical protein
MQGIKVINESLKFEDDRRSESFEVPRFPVLFVIGPPKVASTLFQQLTISTFSIGYVSNIIARFWLAPYFGAQLHKALWDDTFISSFRSEHGNTVGPLEPHEWGLFWRHWLKLEGDDHYQRDYGAVDVNGLARKLAAIESVLGNPLIFDNVFAMANLDILSKLPGKILCIHARRDYYYVCGSILAARLKRYGSLDPFYGHRPQNMETLKLIEDPVEQVVLQSKAIDEEIEKSLKLFKKIDIFTYDYQDLTSRPKGVMDDFAAFLASHGVPLARRGVSFDPRFTCRDTVDLAPPQCRDRLNALFSHHFAQAALPGTLSIIH